MCKKSTFIMAIILLAAFICNAQVPQLINNQGMTTDLNDKPINNVYATEGGGPGNGGSGYNRGSWLLTSQWGQSGCGGYCDLYNLKTPLDPSVPDNSTKKHCGLGCWTVAIGQILRYHELQSYGEVKYETNLINPDGTPLWVSTDLDAHQYAWPLISDILTESSSKNEKEMTSTFLYDVALVIGKQFPEEYIGGSTIRLNGVKDHFDFTEKSYEKNFNDSIDGKTHEAIEKITEEIGNYRPIMLYLGGGHAVVIDGYQWATGAGHDTFKVHLNFGWYGGSDGWYDYSIDDKAQPIKDFTDLTCRWMLFFIVDTPKERKMGIMSVLEGMKTGNSLIDGWIDSAIDDIQNSLHDDYWLDGLHLSPTDGDQMFKYASSAAGKLRAITEATGMSFGKIPNRLASTDAILTKIALHEAENAQAKNQAVVDALLMRANEQVDMANDKRKEHKYELAIWHFKNAWKFAQEAISWTELMPKTISDVELSENIPTQYALYQNHPNPFNPETRIAYQLPEASQVTIKIHNILGQEVITLVNQMQPGGEFEVIWNGRNSSGIDVPSGAYLCIMQAEGTESQEVYHSSIKLLLLR